jgi:hypothetical protein
VSEIISEQSAWKIAREFASELRSLLSDQLQGVAVIGSLGGGYYRPGVSDIDTLIVLSDGPDRDERKTIKTVKDQFLSDYQIPKGLGAITLESRELCAPFDPEKELVVEIIRLKEQGQVIDGIIDMEAIPFPSDADFLAYANVFYPWLRREYIDQRPEDSKTEHALVNTILYELRLLVWHRTRIHAFDKRTVISHVLKKHFPNDLGERLRSVQAYIDGENPHNDVDQLKKLSEDISAVVRDQVPLR